MTNTAKPAKKPVPVLAFFLVIAALVAGIGYATQDESLVIVGVKLALVILAVTVASVLFVRAAKRAGMPIQVRCTFPCGQANSSTTYRLWGINHTPEPSSACPMHGEKCKPVLPNH